MGKAVIAPIVAVLALIAQAFGFDVPEEVVNEVVQHIGNVVLGIVALIGIIKGVKKKDEKEV